MIVLFVTIRFTFVFGFFILEINMGLICSFLGLNFDWYALNLGGISRIWVWI